MWEDGEFGLSLLSFICRWGLQVERSIYTVGNIGQSQKVMELSAMMVGASEQRF